MNDQDLIPKLVTFLLKDHLPKLQYEATRCVDLMSESFEFTQEMFKLGLIPQLLKLISNSNIEIVAEAARALINIAVGNPSD